MMLFLTLAALAFADNQSVDKKSGISETRRLHLRSDNLHKSERKSKADRNDDRIAERYHRDRRDRREDEETELNSEQYRRRTYKQEPDDHGSHSGSDHTHQYPNNQQQYPNNQQQYPNNQQQYPYSQQQYPYYQQQYPQQGYYDGGYNYGGQYPTTKHGHTSIDYELGAQIATSILGSIFGHRDH